MKAAILSLIIASILVPGQSALARPYNEAARIADAERLIAKNEEYIRQSNRLHNEINKEIEIAQTLKGRAQTLDINASAGALTPRLTGAELKAAQAQYAADLQQFKMHAKDYEAHVQQFRQTLGECQANARAYQQQVESYQIHAEAFHMPNIRPPHVCGTLNVSMETAGKIANQIRADQVRLVNAEMRLQQSVADLNAERGKTNALQGSVLNENRRALAEQKLVEEFSRLHSEYETLAIEHKALGKNAATAVSTKVHGEVKQK